jgi:hypothetical protein
VISFPQKLVMEREVCFDSAIFSCIFDVCFL